MDKDHKRICPLLSSAGTVEYEPCMGDSCAWYIPPDRPSLNPEGRCAMTYLASISYGVRAV